MIETMWNHIGRVLVNDLLSWIQKRRILSEQNINKKQEKHNSFEKVIL